MDNTAKSQLVEKLQSATNILVTVSSNPSVDQLSACVGLTLLLNKFGKHATAVYSGETPSTLEFLQPEQTLEKNTDSLRDFIIALDKSKADKLRYKVEDDMVRIFITPFRVSLTAADLEFSQGDFNVDLVLALGVSRQEDFDAAIIAHGRILHDAVVSSISTASDANLGSINWSEPTASSLSEIVVALAHALGDDLLDSQVATALLTGIVSETARFSNEKTTPQTMSTSAELMAAGANQQLVATKLAESAQPAAQLQSQTKTPVDAAPTVDQPPKNEDGTLDIDHDSIEAVLQDLQAEDNDQSAPEVAALEELPAPETELPEAAAEAPSDPSTPSNKQSRLIIEPPTLGGTLTANSEPERLDPGNNILGMPTEPQPALLNRPTVARNEPLLTGFTPPPPAWVPATQDAGNQFNNPEPVAVTVPELTPEPAPEQETVTEPVAVIAPEAVPVLEQPKTLAEIEQAVHAAEGEHLDSVRDEVERALNSQPGAPERVQALGAHPLGEPLHPTDTVAAALAPLAAPAPAFADMLQQVIPAAPAGTTMPVPPAEPAPAAQPMVTDPNSPPPVPPPIPFNFGAPRQ